LNTLALGIPQFETLLATKVKPAGNSRDLAGFFVHWTLSNTPITLEAKVEKLMAIHRSLARSPLGLMAACCFAAGFSAQGLAAQYITFAVPGAFSTYPT
jgi:hypothetical protein